MARVAAIPTTQEIEALYQKGEIEKLRQINETLAKRANQRLKELEKHDLQTAAYNRAMGYIQEYKELGTGRNFSRRKSMDADELVMNIKQESQFLRWQTSTVSGEKKRREKIASGLFKNEKLGFKNLAENENNFKKKFLEFLDNDVWDEFKKRVHSDTNLTMTEAGEAIAGGASVQDLEEAFKKYQSGETETDIWEIWENWTSPANKGS